MNRENETKKACPDTHTEGLGQIPYPLRKKGFKICENLFSQLSILLCGVIHIISYFNSITFKLHSYNSFKAKKRGWRKEERKMSGKHAVKGSKKSLIIIICVVRSE